MLFFLLCRSRLHSSIISFCLKEDFLKHFLLYILLVMNSFSIFMSEKVFLLPLSWKNCLLSIQVLLLGIFPLSTLRYSIVFLLVLFSKTNWCHSYLWSSTNVFFFLATSQIFSLSPVLINLIILCIDVVFIWFTEL